MENKCSECDGYGWLCGGACIDVEQHTTKDDCTKPAECGACRIKKDEQTFLKFLQQVTARPAMYVGLARIRLITTLIAGLTWGHDAGKRGTTYALIGGGSLVNGFWLWVRTQYPPVNHCAWGIERVLLHNHDHDHMKAIAVIPVLYEKWLNSAKQEWFSTKVEDQDAAEKKRIIDCYGKDWGAPECELCEGWQL